SRQGQLFYKAIPLDNSHSAVSSALSISAFRENVGPTQQEVAANENRKAFLPHTPEDFQYDDDGNLTRDGHFIYGWDAENRLTSLETRSDLPSNCNREKSLFSYDYRSRRIEKQVFNWDIASQEYQAAISTRFLYDGWTLVAELDGMSGNNPLRSYVWRLD